MNTRVKIVAHILSYINHPKSPTGGKWIYFTVLSGPHIPVRKKTDQSTSYQPFPPTLSCLHGKITAWNWEHPGSFCLFPQQNYNESRPTNIKHHTINHGIPWFCTVFCIGYVDFGAGDWITSHFGLAQGGAQSSLVGEGCRSQLALREPKWWGRWAGREHPKDLW